MIRVGHSPIVTHMIINVVIYIMDNLVIDVLKNICNGNFLLYNKYSVFTLYIARNFHGTNLSYVYRD